MNISIGEYFSIFGGFTSEKTTSDICKEVEKFGMVWLGGGKAWSDGWPLILLLRQGAAPGDGKDPKVCMAQQSTGSQTAKLLLQPGGRGEIHPNDKEKFNSGLTHFIHTLGHLGLLTNSAQGNYLEQV